MSNEYQILQKLLTESKDIVFFGGAGVSTESGIPDFRSVDGLYNQQYRHPPEIILSHTFFINNTEDFYDFYKNKMLFLNAKPNIAHVNLSTLEKQRRLKAIITQNIDGLHQIAGSKNVLELHGSIHRNYCMKCNKFFGVDTIIESNQVPLCPCGGIIKPDVVLYGEGLNNDVVNSSIEHIFNADVLIVAGTSLSVYPAAGLINYYEGNKLVLINKTPTPVDSMANLVIYDSIGKALQHCF